MPLLRCRRGRPESGRMSASRGREWAKKRDRRTIPVPGFDPGLPLRFFIRSCRSPVINNIASPWTMSSAIKKRGWHVRKFCPFGTLTGEHPLSGLCTRLARIIRTVVRQPTAYFTIHRVLTLSSQILRKTPQKARHSAAVCSFFFRMPLNTVLIRFFV